MFDAAFWTSFVFELIVPLIMTSTLFWVIVFPKAESQMKEVTKALASTLSIPPCTNALQSSLPRLKQMRENMAVVERPAIKHYVLFINVMAIALLGVVSIIVPLAYKMPWKEALMLFLEIVAMYCIIVVAELYFIFEIAFKYMPGRGHELMKDIVGRLASSCFDASLDSADTSATACA